MGLESRSTKSTQENVRQYYGCKEFNSIRRDKEKYVHNRQQKDNVNEKKLVEGCQ